MSEAVALSLRALACGYGPTPVLSGVELDVAAGEMVALLGASGSGKSTLLRAVAGLHPPRAGRIEVGGRLVQDGPRSIVPPQGRGVGFLFQDYALFPALTVEENIAYGLGRDPRGRALELLEQVGLGGLASRRPAELSGGQQQRVALARALAPRPALLLLDEPFANVDAERRHVLAREIRALLAGEGVSALLVTHDREEAFALADRVGAMLPREGGSHLPQCAPPRELYLRPVDAAVARLGGLCAFLGARADGGTARCALGEVGLVETRSGEGTLLCRPEQLAFVPGDGGVELRDLRFTGRAQLLRLRLPGGEALWAEAEATASLQPGTTGRVVARGPLWMLPGPA